jgi:hypothetical protein
MAGLRLVIACAAALMAAAAPASAASVPEPVACDPAAGQCWDPEPTTEPWQIQFQGRIDLSVPAPVYDIDVDSDAGIVDAIHAQGDRAICYISAGSWEPYRSDKGEFPKKLLGRPIAGFEDEHWLDIRRVGRLRPIMAARMDECVAKGFDAIDPDNVDGYQNRTGFPLKPKDQLAYNATIANLAHERGMAVVLKNDLGQVGKLLPYFDFQVNEQCFQYRECDRLDRFIAAGKPVYGIEYEVPLGKFCAASIEHGFSTIYKRYSLSAFREVC